MSGSQSTTRRSVVRASKDQRKLLFLAYEADKTPSKPRLDDIGFQTGLSPDWISRWFARQRRSDKKRATEGCIDLTVKRELLDDDTTAAAFVADPLVPSKRKAARRKPKKCIKKEETPEAPPLPISSSPSLRWSSPMLPSSSPPRTPPHIAGTTWPCVDADALLSPSRLYTRAYSSVGDPFLGPFGADAPKRQPMKAEDAQEALWLSSFTCRTLPGILDYFPGNTTQASILLREHAGPCGNKHALDKTTRPLGLSPVRASGSATPAIQPDRSADAIDEHAIPHEGSSAPRANAPYRLILGGDHFAAPVAVYSGTDEGFELMMTELLAALEAETDVVKIAVLLSQLHRLGLRW